MDESGTLDLLKIMGLDVITGFALGAFMILIASALETLWSFGRQARPDVKPRILRGWFRWVALALWILLLLGGGIFLLAVHPIAAAIGVIGFWLVLPFMITPIMRNRLLPKWEAVKKELAPKGYNEKDYWRGDWWMVEDRRKAKKKEEKAAATAAAKPAQLLPAKKKDYYQVLGVSRSATFDQIAASYRKLALENNPDLSPGLDQAAKDKMKDKAREIEDAFKVLGDPRRRQKYDGTGK
jgi:hypothetical protein